MSYVECAIVYAFKLQLSLSPEFVPRHWWCGSELSDIAMKQMEPQQILPGVNFGLSLEVRKQAILYKVKCFELQKPEEETAVYFYKA